MKNYRGYLAGEAAGRDYLVSNGFHFQAFRSGFRDCYDAIARMAGALTTMGYGGTVEMEPYTHDLILRLRGLQIGDAPIQIGKVRIGGRIIPIMIRATILG